MGVRWTPKRMAVMAEIIGRLSEDDPPGDVRADIMERYELGKKQADEMIGAAQTAIAARRMHRPPDRARRLKRLVGGAAFFGALLLAGLSLYALTGHRPSAYDGAARFEPRSQTAPAVRAE